MTGEKNFIVAINYDWFRRHNNRQNIPEHEALAELKAFAAYNSSSFRAPCWQIEHSLKQLIEHYEEVMGWQPRHVKWAYHLATQQLAKIAIERGYLTPP